MPDETFTISIDVPKDLAPNLTAAAARGAASGIEEGLFLLERVVKQKILAGREERHFGPAIFTGMLMKHVVSEMSRTGINPEGLVGVAPEVDTYALTLEEGRTPGAKMPPSDSLIPWVTEKLGVTGTDAHIAGVAFVVARAIARQGFPGVHMFRNAVAEQQANVVAIVSQRIQEAMAAEAGR
jgi:hypothetical protein